MAKKILIVEVQKRPAKRVNKDKQLEAFSNL